MRDKIYVYVRFVKCGQGAEDRPYLLSKIVLTPLTIF